MWLIAPVVPELIADTVASTVEGAGPPIIHHTKRRGHWEQHWAVVVAQRALSQVRTCDRNDFAYAHPVLPDSGLPSELQSLYQLRRRVSTGCHPANGLAELWVRYPFVKRPCAEVWDVVGHVLASLMVTHGDKASDKMTRRVTM